MSSTAFGAASSPVADAAMSGDTVALRALIARKADVNAPQADGGTAIQWAAYTNNLALADILIKGNANVKLANHDGATALSLAAINGNAPMIEKLLQAGADPNERQPNGETPLMLASRLDAGCPKARILLSGFGAGFSWGVCLLERI